VSIAVISKQHIIVLEEIKMASNDTLKVDSFASGVAFVDISEMREVEIVFILL
jgi:hypothetical protein